MQVPHYWRQQQQRYTMTGETCPQCGTRTFPPRPVCPECASRRDTAVELAAAAELHTALEGTAAR